MNGASPFWRHSHVDWTRDGKTRFASRSACDRRQFWNVTRRRARRSKIRGHRPPHWCAAGTTRRRCATPHHDPVIMLDRSTRCRTARHPSAALLGARPAQNHRSGITLDLGGFFAGVFVATANVADTIPAALFDRMEVIRFDGYRPRKNAIALTLWPRQIERMACVSKVAVTEPSCASWSRSTRGGGVRPGPSWNVAAENGHRLRSGSSDARCDRSRRGSRRLGRPKFSTSGVRTGARVATAGRHGVVAMCCLSKRVLQGKAASCSRTSET